MVTVTDAADERLLLQVRDVTFDWATLPFHYVPGDPFATHVLNVLHLLLPAGEEFFVDVFKKALPLIKDDQLRLDVQGFIGQEALHSQAHSGVRHRPGFHPSQLGGVERAVDYLARSPAARAAH
jgi:predicted metal-dependent hydrolase